MVELPDEILCPWQGYLTEYSNRWRVFGLSTWFMPGLLDGMLDSLQYYLMNTEWQGYLIEDMIHARTTWFGARFMVGLPNEINDIWQGYLIEDVIHVRVTWWDARFMVGLLNELNDVWQDYLVEDMIHDRITWFGASFMVGLLDGMPDLWQGDWIWCWIGGLQFQVYMEWWNIFHWYFLQYQIWAAWQYILSLMFSTFTDPGGMMIKYFIDVFYICRPKWHDHRQCVRTMHVWILLRDSTSQNQLVPSGHWELPHLQEVHFLQLQLQDDSQVHWFCADRRFRIKLWFSLLSEMKWDIKKKERSANVAFYLL